MAIRVKQTLLKIAEERFESLGFKFNEAMSKSSLWVFSRDFDGIAEFIEFQRSTTEKNAIRLFIRTAKDLVGIYGTDLAGKQDGPWWWMFHDDETLISSLQELIDIALNQGMLYLEYVRQPFPDVPIEVRRCLFDKTVELASALKDTYRFEGEPMKDVQELERIIMSKRENVAELDWDFMLKVFAFFGELIRSALSGEWSWDEKDSMPYIVGIGHINGGKVNPLNLVVRFWWNPFRRLNASYSRITMSMA